MTDFTPIKLDKTRNNHLNLEANKEKIFFLIVGIIL